MAHRDIVGTDQQLSDLTAIPLHMTILARTDKLNEKSLSSFLSTDELHRAKRYRRREDHVRSVCSHAIKRLVIGQYLKKAPHLLRFDQGAFGKPLCIEPGAPQFNLSHSRNWVAIAVSSSSNVGVDVEFPAPFSFVNLAREVLSEDSAEQLKKSGSWLDFLFFWTQKESVAKACGLGMTLDLKVIEAEGGPGQQQICLKGKVYQVVSLPLEDGAVSFASASTHPMFCYELFDYPRCRVRRFQPFFAI